MYVCIRWAAKEAMYKALTLRSSSHDTMHIAFSDIVITNDCHGMAARVILYDMR
jgi:phosphopantetheinyl transferase (holo-ACP synthase)